MKKSAGLFSAFGIAISLVVSGLTPSAQAVQGTVTFDGVLNADGSYTENGITVTSSSGVVSLGDVSGLPRPAEPTGTLPDGSQDLINSGPFFGPIYTFAFPGGQPFDVLQVDVVDPGNATFTPSSGLNILAGSFTKGGSFPNGSIFSLPGPPAPPTSLNGPGWLNITSFTMQMGACVPSQPATCTIAIDNLVLDDLGLTPIPEPTTLLLFGSGLVGMGIGTRRRGRKEA